MTTKCMHNSMKSTIPLYIFRQGDQGLCKKSVLIMICSSMMTNSTKIYEKKNVIHVSYLYYIESCVRVRNF